MVKIKLIGQTENGPLFEATDLATNEPVVWKNWYEKSKDKNHIVLESNSANRKYIAHNEFFAKAVDDEYIVEDKTAAPRKLGTAQPDRKLVPFMNEQDAADYDAIIARALANREAIKNIELTPEAKLAAQIAKLIAKKEALEAKLEAEAAALTPEVEEEVEED